MLLNQVIFSNWLKQKEYCFIINVGFPTEALMELILKNYYEYYHVTEQENGVVVLEPRELVDPLTISKNTLNSMDEAMNNLEKGVVFGPVKVK